MTISASRVGALLAGLAYAVLGVVSLTGSVPDQHWGVRGAVVDVLGLVGFAANVLGAEVLRDALGLGTPGRGGVRAAQVGLAAMTVESVASLVHGGDTLTPLFFGGWLVTLLGLLVVAVDGLRQAQARWLAPVPVLALFVGLAGGEHGGFLVLGLVWLALGASRRSVTTRPAALTPR